MENVKPKDLPETFARNLAAARKHAGLSQRALAVKVQTAASSINKWETGKASPTLTSIVALAEALECPPEMLLTGVGEEYFSAASA